MSDISDENDRRSKIRVNLERMMFLRVGDETFTGLLRDVSVSGAKFLFDGEDDPASRLSPGADGAIIVDGIGEVPGTLARFDGGDAVFTFSVPEREQEEIIAGIMIAVNEIDLKPDS